MKPELLSLDDNFTLADVTVIGRARHGKDTVANMLRVLDDRFERIALADELKEHVAGLLSMSVLNLDLERGKFSKPSYSKEHFLTEFKTNKTKYRPLLQWFGTEFVRDFDDRYWIKALNRGSRQSGARYVLTDARFPNEIESRKEFGDFIIKVERPDMVINESNHASESQIDSLPYHILIKNDGTVEDLFGKVREVFDAYLKKA